MKCTRCLAPSRVLDTRTSSDGLFVTRRHECFNNHRFLTHQMPESVVKDIGRTRFADMMARLLRGATKRAESYARERKAAKLLRTGQSSEAIGRQIGITGSAVRAIRKRIEK
jgi:transcriptional regulator NrdR family protein